MLWDSWWNVWRGRSLPKRRRVASGSSLKRAADVAGAWSKQPIESLEDRRLLSAGDLDQTFGSAGKITVAAAGSANGIAVQDDGKIVVVGGPQNGKSTMMRFNSDGTLDTTFDSDGKVANTFTGSITCLAIQGDGKIVVGGGDTDFRVARFNSDGSLDATFGVGGTQTTDFSGVDHLSELVIQSDGKIVVVGTNNPASGDSDFAMARYNVDGTLDTTFGIDGKITTDFGTLGDVANGVAIDTSGRIVVVGSATSSSITHIAIARYSGDGSLDSSFATGGKRVVAYSAVSEDFGNDVAIQDDGSIIVAGSSGILGNTNLGPNTSKSSNDYNVALVRFTNDGSLDSAFGSGGWKIVNVHSTSPDGANAIKIQSDGRMVIAGYDGSDFLVARFKSNGNLDSFFGTSGKRTFDFGKQDAAQSVAIQSDGNIVVAGVSTASTIKDFAIARLRGIIPPVLTVSAEDATRPEGGSGATPFTFTVTRDEDISGTTIVNYGTIGSGATPADADDFGGTFPSGTLTFEPGETSKTITINVVGDATIENNEGFNFALTRVIGDAIIIDAGFTVTNAKATIINDDFVDLRYFATDNQTISAVVLSTGHLQVTIDSVVQSDVAPVAVKSLAITGANGNDSINLSGLSRSIYPNLTSIVLIGGEGDDTIIGSSLNETISGGTGDDSLSGGGGVDRLVEEIAAPSDPAVRSIVSVARTESKTQYTMSGLGADTIADIEEMSLAGSAGKDKIDVKKFRGSVTLSGNGGNDTLIGGAGNDSLDGGEGNDKLTGNGGTNQLAGGNGTDYVIEAGATNFVLTPATLTGLGNETLSSIERASLTTANTSSRIDASAFLGNTILTGGSGNDTLLGGTGKDSITGGDGNDTLNGGNGNDTLDGGAGDDALVGQNGHDLLMGGDGQDTLIGSAGHDTLKGGLGDDLLIGGLGKDSLDGEAGNDTGLGGQGGAARGGTGLKNAGDSLIGIELLNEDLATLFPWE